MEEAKQYQIIQLTKDGISFKEMDYKIKNDEDSKITGGYAVYENQEVAAKGVKRIVMLNVVELSFSSDVLFFSDVILGTDAINGCLLDRDSMYALFGTVEVEGQQLFYQEKEYTVKGLVDSEEPLIVIQNTEEDRVVGNLVLDCREEFYRDKYYMELYYFYPFSGKSYYIADYTSFFHWIETPNKWSDFDFWRMYGNRIKDRWREMLFRNKDVVEVWYYRLRLQSLCYELEMIVCVCLIAVGLVNRKKKKGP